MRKIHLLSPRRQVRACLCLCGLAAAGWLWGTGNFQGISRAEEPAVKTSETESTEAARIREIQYENEISNRFADRDFSKFSDDPPIAKPMDPIPLKDIDDSVVRGIQFLLKNQNRDGSWGLPTRTKRLNIYAPGTAHEGYRTGTTALVLESLLKTEALILKDPKVLPELKALLPEITKSIDRCEEWMFVRMLKLKRSAPDVLYNNWGHSYGMSAFYLMYIRKHPEKTFSGKELKERQEKILNAIRYQIHMLESCECLAGGWCYYDRDHPAQKPSASTLCFMTGTVLVSLADAQKCGVEISPILIKRAKDSILRQRRPNGSFAYGEYTANYGHRINHTAPSLGRSQVCHLALDLWGDSETVNQQVYEDWMNRLVVKLDWLDVGRKKPVPHESWFGVAGYFYYYAHYYAARVLDEMENDSQKALFSNHLADALLKLQEKDGSWWDYPLYDYHPYYGTGMAVSSILHYRECIQKESKKK